MHIHYLFLFFHIIASTDFQIQVSVYESIGWIAIEVEILKYLLK